MDFSVILGQFFQVGFMRLFGGRESAQMDFNSFTGNPCPVSAAYFTDSLKAGFIIFLNPPVNMVYQSFSGSQIMESVIRGISIDMVDHFRRLTSCLHEPCKTMGIHVLPHEFNRLVTVRPNASRKRSFFPGSGLPDIFQPGKNPRFRIVGQKLFKLIKRREITHEGIYPSISNVSTENATSD